MLPPPEELAVTVRASAQRLGVLLRGVAHPSAPALGSWNLTDVAVHVAHAVEAVTALARGGGPLLDDLSGLATLTTSLVGSEEERDLSALADRIEDGAAVFVQVVSDLETAERRDWLVKGVEVSAPTIFGHVLNELVVHGWDIAQAEGVRWPIPERHAALVLDAFLLPTLGNLGSAIVDPKAAAGVRASFDLHLRGGGRHLMRFLDGDLTVEAVEPSRRLEGIDCRLSVAPSAFLLVAWGRRSQWPAIARGQMLAWGRRPWLGVRLRSLLVNP